MAKKSSLLSKAIEFNTLAIEQIRSFQDSIQELEDDAEAYRKIKPQLSKLNQMIHPEITEVKQGELTEELVEIPAETTPPGEEESAGQEEVVVTDEHPESTEETQEHPESTEETQEPESTQPDGNGTERPDLEAQSQSNIPEKTRRKRTPKET